MAQLVAMPTFNSEVSKTQFLSVETFEVSLVVVAVGILTQKSKIAKI
jgi:hypothetical protein